MCCEDLIERLEDSVGAEKLQRIFCWVIVLETFLFSGLTLTIMFIEDGMDTSTDGEMMRFGPSFIFANLVFLYFAINAIFTQNKFSLIAFMFVMFVLSIYVVFQFLYYLRSSPKDILFAISLVRFIFIITMQPLNIIFFTIAYNSCGWKVYKQLGADSILLEMYDKYQIFITIISALLFLNILVLLIIASNFYLKGLSSSPWYIYIDIGIIGLDVLSSGIGIMAIRREKIILLVLYFILSLPITPALVYRGLDTAKQFGTAVDYEFFIPILVLGSCAIIGRVMLYIVSIFTCSNFGNQLLGRVDNAFYLTN